MPIRIAITSDFICPWCYIGERRLARAIATLPAETAIELTWRPFELNTAMPAEGMDRKTYRSLKFGNWERSRMLDAHTVAAAQGDGIVFDYDAMQRTPNTLLAHRLMQLAARHGLATQVAQALFQGYFEQGLDLGDAGTLAAIAGKQGVDHDEVATFLAGAQGLAEVRAAQQDARLSGVRSVPWFDIAGEVISGAQSVEVFTAALRRAL